MTELQRYALATPLARANESFDGMQLRRRVAMPWSVILTVNK